MKKNFEYLTRLRQVMAEQKVDVVIISGTDPHQSENPQHHWRDREWITGFWSTNGTNGTNRTEPNRTEPNRTNRTNRKRKQRKYRK